MTAAHHEDPVAEGAARAAQFAAMAVSVAEAVVRLRTERLATRAADDERQAAAVRAQHRAEQATALLQRSPANAPTPGPAEAPRIAVTIVCGPRDVADQAFPVPMPAAMATAPRAARDAVRPAGTLPAAPVRAQLTGPAPSRPSAGPR